MVKNISLLITVVYLTGCKYNPSVSSINRAESLQSLRDNKSCTCNSSCRSILDEYRIDIVTELFYQELSVICQHFVDIYISKRDLKTNLTYCFSAHNTTHCIRD